MMLCLGDVANACVGSYKANRTTFGVHETGMCWCFKRELAANKNLRTMDCVESRVQHDDRTIEA